MANGKTGLTDRLSVPTQEQLNVANQELEGYYNEVAKQALADRLANRELQKAAIESVKPQVDITPALAFFSDWTGNKAALQSYKRPEDTLERLAQVKQMIPVSRQDEQSATIAALKNKRDQLEEMKKAEDAREKAKYSFDANDMLRNQLMQMQLMNMSRDQQEKALKRQEEEQKREVPGYQRDLTVIPSEKDVETLKAIRSKYGSIESGLGSLKDLVSEHGTKIWPDETKTKMTGIYNDLKVQLKELANLGALTKDDLALVEGQLRDPTSIMNLFQDKGVLESIDQTLKNARARVESEATARGFTPQFLDKEQAVSKTKGKGNNGLLSSEAVAAPTEKTINGVKYKKVNGGWEEVQ